MSIWCQQVVQTKMMWKRHQHGNVKGQTLLVWAKWLVLCAFHSENWFNPIMRLWVPNFHPSPFSNYCCIGLNMFLLFARITVITFLLVGKQLMTVNEHVKHIQVIQVYMQTTIPKITYWIQLILDGLQNNRKSSFNWTPVDHWGTLEHPHHRSCASLFASMDWTTFAWSFCALSMADWQNTPPRDVSVWTLIWTAPQIDSAERGGSHSSSSSESTPWTPRAKAQPGQRTHDDGRLRRPDHTEGANSPTKNQPTPQKKKHKWARTQASEGKATLKGVQVGKTNKSAGS